MNQDILNLNKTTKSILKNPDNRSSLAFSNSILRKDPSKINTEGIGFNPNLGVEDEYIANLQKQMHFMDLEIKLMKEKQQQDEALGGNYNFTKIGLKDGFESTMDHIITATSKIKDLKMEATTEINGLEADLQMLQRENEIERAKLNSIKKQLEQIEDRNTKVFTEKNGNLNEIKTKLLNEKKARETVEADITRLQAQYNAVVKENEKLIKDTDLKNINQALSDKKFEQDKKFDEETIQAKLEIIQSLEKEKAEYFKLIENDTLLQGYRKDNESLLDKLKLVERDLNGAKYEVLQYETLQKLSDEQKEAEIAERKKLQLDLEKWKNQLEDTVKNNELKIEKKLKESVSADIKQAQANLLKEERELADLRKKYQAIEESERAYIIDENNRKRYLENMLKKNDETIELNNKLDNDIATLNPQVEDLFQEIERLTAEIENNTRKRDQLKKDMVELQESNIELESKYKHMSKNVNYNEVVRKFRADDLNALKATNFFMNNSIEKFMEVWGFMKTLSTKDY